MILKRICVLLLLISSITFAQSDTYIEVILDGQKAYMYLETGEIVIKKPSDFKNETTKSTNNTSIIEETKNHFVKAGETLYSISRKYGVSVDEICALNNRPKELALVIGEEIRLSSPDMTVNNNSEIYIVSKGDTLYSISKKIGISVITLKEVNHLSSNIISIGQVLKIK